MKAINVILALSYLIVIVFFVATNSPYAFALMVLVLLIPHISILLCKLGADRTHISFKLGCSCSAGQSLPLEIVVQRPHLLRGRIELEFMSRNVMTGTLVRHTVMLEPAWEAQETFVVEVDTSCVGRTEVKLLSARSCDSLGLSSKEIDVETTETSYTVFPVLRDINVLFANEESQKLIGVTSDYRGKGRDRSEVFDVREYREGDSLKSIHWKLSARLDDIIVKEPARPADYDMALFYDLSASDSFDKDQADVLNAALSALVSVSLGLVRLGVSHTLVTLNNGAAEGSAIDDFPVLEKTMGLLVSVPVGQHVEIETVLDFVRSHSITKVILVTDHFDEAYSSIASWTNLSVLHVGASGGEAVSSLNYRISHITPEALDSKVKSLEL